MSVIKTIMQGAALALWSGAALANPLNDADFWKAEDLDLARVQATAAEGNSIHEMNPKGYNALFYAGEYGASPEIIDWLVAEGADINAIGHDERPPIFYITKGGSLAAVKAFLAHGPRLDIKDEYGRNMFAHATRKQTDLAVYELMREIGVDALNLDDAGRSALHEAAQRSGSIEVLEYLNGLGLDWASTDKDGTNLYLLAAGRNSHVDVAAYLGDKLDAWESTDSDGNNAALRAAFRVGSVPMLELAESHGADPLAVNKDGDTALILAAYRSPLEMVQAYLERGVDVNAANAKGETALIRAAIRNAPEVTAALLAAGAKADAAAENGDTALSLAAANPGKGRDEIITQLIAAGASASGTTALNAAAEAGQPVAVLKALLAAGADVNAVDGDGYSALMQAAVHATDPTVVLTLLEAGADASIADDFDDTALTLIEENAALADGPAAKALAGQ